MDAFLFERICEPLNLSLKPMKSSEGPYLPLSISLHRAVGFKIFTGLVLDEIKDDTERDHLTHLFFRKVDMEILDNQLQNQIKILYKKKI